MFACNEKRIQFALALALAVAVVPPLAARATEDAMPNAGRLALLEKETARFASVPAQPATTNSIVIAVALAAGLSASFLGTYFGMRRFAFGRLVERDGWREVTYRVRSTPLSIQGGTLGRMSKVLEDLERLSAEIPGAGMRVPIAALRAPEPELPAEPVRIVTFARRQDASPGPVSFTPTPSATPIALERTIPPPAPLPVAPTLMPTADRYRRARTLFSEGFDLITVQAMTGLKRAELDLVRGTPQPAPRAA